MTRSTPGEGAPVWVMIFEGEIFAECEHLGLLALGRAKPLDT